MTSERQQFFLLKEDLLRPEHPSARCHAGCKSTNPGRSPGFELRSLQVAPVKDTSEKRNLHSGATARESHPLPYSPCKRGGHPDKIQTRSVRFPELNMSAANPSKLRLVRITFALSASFKSESDNSYSFGVYT